MRAWLQDDRLDNGTLQFMNVDVANSWKGPMKKGTFLVWVSLVDAAATLLFFGGLVALALVARRFVRKVDADTLEVSDYTVIVRGLPPDTDATEVRGRAAALARACSRHLQKECGGLWGGGGGRESLRGRRQRPRGWAGGLLRPMPRRGG